ncbi:MAG: hypothetical protein GWN07_23775 [Actinobacteria bacterium]|nr:hypothetical protein [Actinomycetota bacterium]NIS33563.1 hypothetical protein [Actinomycetota bacterium]NIT95321.1 hypothetical protein [Actinomycetota bacterium]NIU68435.1 hypothetical protein [Actinomycetota bacterium]NIX22682.1 hypothetical protein [Actinomycetota bacterium]
MKRIAAMFVAVVAVMALLAPAASAEPAVGFGELYYDGDVVRTVVPPAAMKKAGTDPFYAIPNQMPVIGTAPGDTDYRGGQWAWHDVTWNVAPYELTSEAEVQAAATAGDITITRVTAKDFKCPVQP